MNWFDFWFLDSLFMSSRHRSFFFFSQGMDKRQNRRRWNRRKPKNRKQVSHKDQPNGNQARRPLVSMQCHFQRINQEASVGKTRSNPANVGCCFCFNSAASDNGDSPILHVCSVTGDSRVLVIFPQSFPPALPRSLQKERAQRARLGTEWSADGRRTRSWVHLWLEKLHGTNTTLLPFCILFLLVICWRGYLLRGHWKSGGVSERNLKTFYISSNFLKKVKCLKFIALSL